MFYNSIDFKKRLGFLSLAILCSVASLTQAFAMEAVEDDEAAKYRHYTACFADPQEGIDQAAEDAARAAFQGYCFFSSVIDNTEDLETVEREAIHGCKEAQFRLSLRFGANNQGEGSEEVDQLKLAFYWMQQAAEKNHVTAQYLLATCYDNHTYPEIEQRLFWLKRSAGNGHAHSQFLYGLDLINGVGGVLEKNREEGVYWIKLAAEASHEVALCTLARLYEQDPRDSFYGLEQQDLPRAVMYYKLAADQKDPVAYGKLLQLFKVTLEEEGSSS